MHHRSPRTAVATARRTADPHRLRTALSVCALAALALGAQRVHAADAAPGDAEGVQIEAAVVAVMQRAGAAITDSGARQVRGSVRADLFLQAPLGEFAGWQASGAAQARFGLGSGVSLRPTYTGAVNSAGFAPEPGDPERYGVLAQALVTLEREVGSGGHLALTIGKLDLFCLFDQNALAADESRQFLNNVFVHQPLLDSGGDIAADDFGFAPGLKLAYGRETGGLRWALGLGIFASGPAAAFDGSPKRPLVIGQFELSPAAPKGEEPAGTLRVYAWSNGRTSDVLGNEQRHSGLGLSFDHRVGADTGVFLRWGRRSSGNGQFDRAFTAGAEWSGRAWGREGDALGIAVGQVPTGSAWRSATADASLVGYAATGSERLLELYYRWAVSDRIEFSPDFQWIRRPGGDATAPALRLIGLRARVGF